MKWSTPCSRRSTIISTSSPGAHPSLESMSLDRAVSLDSINPYHMGAIRFFEDRGMWTAAASRMQERLLRELGATR